MRISVPTISLHSTLKSKKIATIYLIAMCVQIVAIESYGISPIKVGLMAFAPLIFILKTPYINKALIWGILYWMVCYFVASFHGNMRFSTIGYLGMFVVSYIVFYSLVYSGAFTMEYFIKLLRVLILLFGIFLLMQQIAMVIGVYSFPVINLTNQHFLSLTKLPSLTIEPSHTARILTVMMLAYWRCHEIVADGERITFKELFTRKHKWVTISFLWTMLTMGSGTAFIGIGILTLYFLKRKTMIYILSILLIFIFAGQAMEFEQMDRAIRVIQATATFDIEKIQTEDGSAASRIKPIINTLKINPFEKESWFGKGTMSHEYASKSWMRSTDKIAIVEQYGLLALFFSLLVVFTCMIKYFWSIETLIFALLFSFTLGNIAYIWGAMMVFTVVRFFQVRKEQGLLEVENIEE